MKNDRKHDHHDKPRVDLRKHTVRLDSSHLYEWKERPIDFSEDVPDTRLKWYRVKGDGTHRLSDRKDRRRIRKLELLLNREEEQAERLHASESASASASDSDAVETEGPEQDSVDVKLTPWQKHTQQGPPEKGCEIKRSKYGVRVYSNDHKTYWDICVNNSTKYPGNTSVRIFVGGKAWTSTFDLETMEALRREFNRGKRP